MRGLCLSYLLPGRKLPLLLTESGEFTFTVHSEGFEGKVTLAGKKNTEKSLLRISCIALPFRQAVNQKGGKS